MYQYLDLCNQQVFLSKLGRISKDTWVYWLDGISTNLQRPAFARAWSEIAARSNGDFSELRGVFPPKTSPRVAAEPNKTMQPTL
jgi:hypothetical protein